MHSKPEDKTYDNMVNSESESQEGKSSHEVTSLQSLSKEDHEPKSRIIRRHTSQKINQISLSLSKN
jgi:hypothetical protein